MHAMHEAVKSSADAPLALAGQSAVAEGAVHAALRLPYADAALAIMPVGRPG